MCTLKCDLSGKTILKFKKAKKMFFSTYQSFPAFNFVEKIGLFYSGYCG